MPSSEYQQRERIPTAIFPTADEACRRLAAEIAELIRSRAAAGRPVVLGLATGSTPVRLYRQLIELHRHAGLSFRGVITFNLDEYHGLPPTHPESYRRFMQEQLFDHIDILPENTHVPDGCTARAAVYEACARYEQAIRDAGGIDLQVLGIGRTGHIGFNEPGSSRDSRTRLVTLDRITRRDAARDFLGEANVPRHAITMGVGTILEARRIVLLAWGEAKSAVVARAIEGAPTDSLPASLLQDHPAVSFQVDAGAAGRLTRVQHPWLVGPVAWDAALTRRAVVWLSLTLGKPILKLLDEDYAERGMADLLTEQGPAYDLNIRIFNELQHTITGWPGGKPGADDAHRPERAQPHPKRVVILSPEPSDDVLGMGGTLRRLVQQGHDVTIAYLTSGNLAVPDEEAAIATNLVLTVLAEHKAEERTAEANFARDVRTQLEKKEAYASDTPAIRQLKGHIRRAETAASLKVCGVSSDHTRFLDLPFYEKGRYRQFQLGAADARAVAELLHGLQPHQIFVTGRAEDPNSVAALSFELLRQAWTLTAGEPWQAACRIWLFRSAQRPWSADEIDMAVPLSPHELKAKLRAIYHHKSQRGQGPADGAGDDPALEVERQNRALAKMYDALGLAEYEAIEGFERWQP